jgi:hypothetical protein
MDPIKVIKEKNIDVAANFLTEDDETKGLSKHEKDEILAERKDKLEQAAEELSNEKEHYKIDPNKIKEDREILHDLQMGHGEVTKAQPGYCYLWVYYGQQGQQVWAAKALGTGNDPEARELKEADGTRRLGDVLLMRITKERYEELKRAEEIRRRMQQEGVTSRILELGEKAKGYGIKVITDPDAREMPRGGNLMESMKKRAASHGASKMRTKMLKEGKVPGMPGSEKR